jgi:hypothetical protein
MQINILKFIDGFNILQFTSLKQYLQNMNQNKIF